MLFLCCLISIALDGECSFILIRSAEFNLGAWKIFIRDKKVTEFRLQLFHCCVCKNIQLKITTVAYGKILNHHHGVWKNIQLKITYPNWLKQSIPHFTQWKKFSLPPTLVELSGYMIRNQLNNLYIGESFFCAHLHMPQSLQWYCPFSVCKRSNMHQLVWMVQSKYKSNQT